MTPAINIRPGSKDAVPAAPQAEFLPKDDLNAKLVANVYPSASYENPEPLEKYDLVRVRRSVSIIVNVYNSISMILSSSIILLFVALI